MSVRMLQAELNKLIDFNNNIKEYYYSRNHQYKKIDSINLKSKLVKTNAFHTSAITAGSNFACRYMLWDVRIRI